MRPVTCFIFLVLCLGAATARRLILDADSSSQVGTLSAADASKQADILIEALNSTAESKAQSDIAVNILGVAVSGEQGVTATAVILPRLSEYISRAGCTPSIKTAIKNLLETEYNGSTTAFTSALRSLDVWNTPVGDLGACLEEVTSSTAVTKSEAQGNGR